MSYECQIPTCNRKVNIRSTIKQGEYAGKKVCQICKKKYDTVTKDKPDYTNFFKYAIEVMNKVPYCENCGGKIDMSYNTYWNIAHILPKSKYKSVATNPYNNLFLCSSKDNTGRDCHREYDNNIEDIVNMPCFAEAKRKFEIFKPNILERGKLFRIFEEN